MPPLPEAVTTRVSSILQSWVGWISRRRHKEVIAALAVCIPIYAITLVLCAPAFETNDDATFLMIASGMLTGEPSEYLVFTNILIGRALKWLYTLNGDFDWYSSYLLSAHFLPSVGILYSFLRLSFSRRSLGFFLLLFLGFQLPLLLKLQFTSAAATASLAGFLILVSAQEKRVLAVVCGIALVVFGAMIRHHSFLLATIMLAPLAVMCVVASRRIWCLSGAIVAVALSFAAIEYHSREYAKDPEWSAYLRYNSTRGALHDRPLLRYEEEKAAVYAEIGWKPIDLAMFANWYFVDEDTYSYEKLHKLEVEFAGTRTPGAEIAASMLAQCGRVIGRVLLILTAWYVCQRSLGQTRRLYSATVLAATLLALAVCLHLAGSYKLPDRVFDSVLLFVGGTVVFGAALMEQRSGGATPVPYSPRAWSATIFAFGASIGLIGEELFKVNLSNSRKIEAFAESVEPLRTAQERHMANGRNPAFIVPGAELSSDALRPFSGGKALDGLHLVTMGWLTHSPLYREQLRRHSITAVAEEIVGRPEVYLLCNSQLSKAFEYYVNAEMRVDAKFFIKHLGGEAFMLNVRNPKVTMRPSQE